MATFTQNYNLKKPDQQDFYNVEDFNNNADIIDEQLKEMADKADSALPASDYTAEDILNKLKTVDGTNSGLDADLFKGKSIIPVENGGTGVNSLDNFLFAKSKSAETTKLFDMTTSGIYLINKGNAIFTDWPSAIGNLYIYGLLEVQRNNHYITQRLILTISATTGTKIRTRFINTDISKATSWVEIKTSETIIPIANGGTGATTASAARTNLGVAYGTTAGTVCQGNDSRLTNARTPTAHNQSASTITAGTLPGQVVANSNTDYTTAQIRNIQASTTDLTAGSSTLTNGNIYIVYE